MPFATVGRLKAAVVRHYFMTGQCAPGTENTASAVTSKRVLEIVFGKGNHFFASMMPLCRERTMIVTPDERRLNQKVQAMQKAAKRLRHGAACEPAGSRVCHGVTVETLQPTFLGLLL